MQPTPGWSELANHPSKVTMKRLFAVALTLHMLALAPQYASAQQGAPEHQADMVVNQTQRDVLIDATIKQLNDNYVFPHLAIKVEASLRQHQARGTYNNVTSAQKLSALLTEHMQAVTRDKHLGIGYSERPIPLPATSRSPSAEEHAARLAHMKAMNFGVERVERLPFNIGYLDLRNFVRASASAPALAAAMTLVANTDALIIDLRRNGGGDPSTVTLLASYLLKERTHLNDMYYRPTNRTEQMWSSDVVMGERFGHEKDVYVLTSKNTFSAAENFSFVMKNLKRVTIVGETTGGGAHPGEVVRLHPHFDMFVPRGRAYDPATNTNWEGAGVTPHVPVKAADALKVAQVTVLKKKAAAAKDPGVLLDLNRRIAAVKAQDTSGIMEQ